MEVSDGTQESHENFLPGIHLDKDGVYWASLAGDHAKLWKARYPGKPRPRKRAKTFAQAVRLQSALIKDLKEGRDPNSENPTITDLVKRHIDRKQRITDSTRKRYLCSWQWQIQPLQFGKVRKFELTKSRVEALNSKSCRGRTTRPARWTRTASAMPMHCSGLRSMRPASHPIRAKGLNYRSLRMTKFIRWSRRRCAYSSMWRTPTSSIM
jgi:hypothetical protein